MKKIVKLSLVILVAFFTVFIFKIFKNYRIYKMINDSYQPKYYINDLYQSKEFNYRFVLDGKEQKIYDSIIEGFINFDSRIEINLSNLDYSYDSQYLKKTSEIIRDILVDHPELIHVGIVAMTTQKGSGYVVIIPNYVMTKDNYQASIDEMKKTIEIVQDETKKLNDYEKVKYVYDSLGNNNSYGDTSDPVAQSAYSAFSSKLSPVCAGYARASQILFYNIGIKSLLVAGDAKYALFLGNPHEWNVVLINSKFYLYDVTMSSGSDTDKEFYRGFLTDGRKHLPANKKIYPYLNIMK